MTYEFLKIVKILWFQFYYFGLCLFNSLFLATEILIVTCLSYFGILAFCCYHLSIKCKMKYWLKRMYILVVWRHLVSWEFVTACTDRAFSGFEGNIVSYDEDQSSTDRNVPWEVHKHVAISLESHKVSLRPFLLNSIFWETVFTSLFPHV